MAEARGRQIRIPTSLYWKLETAAGKEGLTVEEFVSQAMKKRIETLRKEMSKET